MPLTAEYVLSELEKHADVLRGFGVKRIGIFGSVARGEAREDSDLDFLVELAQPSFKRYTGLLLFLDNLFGRPTEVVLLDDIRPQWKDAVLAEVKYAARV